MAKEPNVIKEPRLYDLFNQKCKDDIQLYIDLFRDADKVLELGVGTGRIAIPLAEQGISIVGVDISLEMLDLLRKKLISSSPTIKKRIELIQQDFCKLSIAEKFNYAVYPFCTFNYLLTLTQQVEALTALKKHLNKDAIVVFDLMTINTFKDMLYKTDIVPFETTYDSEMGLDVIMLTQGFFNQATQVYTQERFFKYYTNLDGVLEKRVRMTNRIFFLGEFQMLLEKCGYKIKELYGSYKLSPFTTASENLIVIAMVE